MKIAVVGSGISGLLAARLLAMKHDVRLWEAGNYLGGHANTIEVCLAGRTHAVDVGFMVFNQRTYPHFCRLLELLHIEKQASDMSFSVRVEANGLEYCGTSLNTMFAQRSNLLRPKFWRMLAEIVRFNRSLRKLAEQHETETTLKPGVAGSLDEAEAHDADFAGDIRSHTLREYLRNGGYSREVCEHYILPMVSAIWSCPVEHIERFPVPFLAKFFRNHGLLDLANRPQWFTVSGSSRRYVRALAAPLTGRCQLNRPIERLVRGEQGITLHAGRRQHTFDAVILAVHSDTTLRLLAKPSEAEQRILGAIQYQPNTAVVHCDSSVMPRKRRAWASWNAHMLDRAGQPASITYWLNRLQNFSSAEPVYVTLGAAHNVRPEKVLRTINYQHPVYSHAAVAAQRRWHQISGRRGIHYCGAYWRNGFHEDGVVSALAVTQQFGLSLENLPGGSAIATSPQRTEANLLM